MTTFFRHYKNRYYQYRGAEEMRMTVWRHPVG